MLSISPPISVKKAKIFASIKIKSQVFAMSACQDMSSTPNKNALMRYLLVRSMGSWDAPYANLHMNLISSITVWLRSVTVLVLVIFILVSSVLSDIQGKMAYASLIIVSHFPENYGSVRDAMEDSNPMNRNAKPKIVFSFHKITSLA